MNQTTSPLDAVLHRDLDSATESPKVQVKLLDMDDLTLASGTATVPLPPGVGIFWPSCPMPPANRLGTAKYFALPTGETMSLKSLTQCAGDPPRYEFRLNSPGVE